MPRLPRLILLASCALGLGLAHAQEAPKPRLEKVKCGALKKLTRLGSVYMAGQPGQKELRALKDTHKVALVVNLRTPPEMSWDEKAFVEGELKLRYLALPFGPKLPLTDAIIDRFREVLTAEKKTAVLVHCASANRVGALWLAVRVLDQGIPYEAALKEARAVGLRSPGLLKKAREYIEARKKP